MLAFHIETRTDLNAWGIHHFFLFGEDLCYELNFRAYSQLVKNLPAMQETLVQYLGWEDPLGKG